MKGRIFCLFCDAMLEVEDILLSPDNEAKNAGWIKIHKENGDDIGYMCPRCDST